MIRVQNAIVHTMPEAEDLWDSVTVIKLGKEVEADLLVCKFVSDEMQNNVIFGLTSKMARAYSRQNDFPMAISYYDKSISVCQQMHDPLHEGRCISRKCYMQMKLRQYHDAQVGYERIRVIGRDEGLFELYSKASVGLSQLARFDGRLADAMEFALEARKSALLQLPGDYGKDWDEAYAIFEIVECSDVDSLEFDEGLLYRLQELGVAIDTDERQGGSLVSIRAANLLGARHVSMGKFPEAVAAYQEVVRMATNPKFCQMPEVQMSKSRALFQILIHGV